MSDMRGRPSLIASALAVLAGPVLASCTATPASGPAHHAASSPTWPAASHPRPSGPIGSPGHPRLLGCGRESFTVPPVSYQPQPGDLVVGPLFIGNAKNLATGNPADFGVRGSYKIPFVLSTGSTATVTIAAPARGQVVLDAGAPGGGVTAATYHSCPGQPGFFPQIVTFINGKIRGCVPLDVTAGQDARIHRITLSLFAGRCTP
jgi:hypothetical protein